MTDSQWQLESRAAHRAEKSEINGSISGLHQFITRFIPVQNTIDVSSFVTDYSLL